MSGDSSTKVKGDPFFYIVTYIVHFTVSDILPSILYDNGLKGDWAITLYWAIKLGTSRVLLPPEMVASQL